MHTTDVPHGAEYATEPVQKSEPADTAQTETGRHAGCSARRASHRESPRPDLESGVVAAATPNTVDARRALRLG
jgi:hypothetical protein